MEKSTLFDLIERAIIHDWRANMKNDTLDCLDRKENETKSKLLKELPEKLKTTLTHYSLAIENRMDYLHYNLQIKILNLGIKIGMELKSSFLYFEE